MTGFSQQQFLGASISRFSASIGWGRTQSSLTVTLAEDPVTGDDFSPPLVGQPVYFNYSGWTFGGLLQSWVERNGEGGNEFIVTVVDPRELLEGVQLILAGYTGGVYGVPNLYNIYGYLESAFGFGGSQINESGMPWYLIRNAFQALQQTTQIVFRGYNYYIDFTNLPILTDYFRISGDNISLMDFVDQVCSAAACDYFITLVGQYITINTISRRSAPALGTIYSFTESVQANTKEAGVELRNETTSKFLIGGPVQGIQYVEHDININDANIRLYVTDATTIYNNDTTKHANVNLQLGCFQELSDLNETNTGFRTNSYYNNILPYWGTYHSTGATIIGSYNPEGDYLYIDEKLNPRSIPHRFTIDVYHLGLVKVAKKYNFKQLDENGNSMGCPYYTDVMELRAVIAGQDAWETFLQTYNSYEYLDTSGTGTHQALGLVNPHYKKAEDLSIINSMQAKVARDGFTDTLSPIDCVNPQGKTYSLADDKTETTHEKDIRKLYEFLSVYANEYFGRKYMVQIPDVYVKKIYQGASVDTDVLFTSLEPTDGGFLDESLWDDAIASGKLPYDINKFTMEDGKIEAFVRYDEVYRNWYDPEEDAFHVGMFYNVDSLSPEDFTLWQGKLYVKCTVDPKLVFLGSGYDEPRVVITLNSPVTRKIKYSLQIGPISYALKDAGATQAQIESMRNKASGSVLSDINPPIYLTPNAAAIPLKSNINTYGPWYVVGAQGKTEVEQDTTLVPWNYGGFQQMNLVANAKLSSAATFFQAGETGTITFAGVPVITLGGLLVASGPYVTDVSVDIGPQGATTTYRMNTWAFQFGQPQKVFEERFRKITMENQQRRRESRELYKKIEGFNSKNLLNQTYKTVNLPRRLAPKTISPLIIGEVYGSGTDNKMVDVFMANPHDIASTMYQNYPQKAGGSLDTIFTPFCTDSGNAYGFNGPSFVEPNYNLDANCWRLDPFYLDQDNKTWVKNNLVNFRAMVTGSGIPDDGLVSEGDTARQIGLRGPVVIAGWGLNRSGLPIPNNDPNNVKYTDFYTGYAKRLDLWKAGPFDARWDEDSGLWTSAPTMKIGYVENDVVNNSVGAVKLVESNGARSSYIDDYTPYISPYVSFSGVNIIGVTIDGGSYVRVDYVDGWRYPLISPYQWGEDC